MIKIKQSTTADTRTCDVSKVSKEQLLASSNQHRDDVAKGFDFFIEMMKEQSYQHDWDKLSNIGHFYSDFTTKFKKTGWWDNHRKVNRHHLLATDGVPSGVNLIDVIDMIVDCVMAGMGRSGSVFHLEINPQVLLDAFNNTIELLKDQVVVET